MNPAIITSWKGTRACVIGGTGFLGFQIVDRLLARGAVVRVLAPSAPEDHPIRTRPEAEWIVGDVRDETSVASAVKGCRVVFQASGSVSVGNVDRTQQLGTHTAGTRAVLAVLPRGCRLVHTSSLVAIGGTRDCQVLDESVPFPHANLRIEYVRAKRDAEEVALSAVATGGDVVVTNPAYLIGPEDYGRSVMGQFCVRFWRGRIPCVPPGGYNFVDVRDVAEGHVLAAERGRNGERYFLGGENLSLRSFVGLLAETADVRPRWLPLCHPAAFAALAVMQELRQFWSGKTPYPSFEHVRLNRYAWFATAAKAIRELGFHARPVQESVLDTFDWHSARTNMKWSGFNRWWFRPPRLAPAISVR